MIIQVILPQLGDTMDSGTVTRWYKKEGDAVKKGEPLFEVLTDKANIDVEATASGFLRNILCAENETAPTGQVIAYLTTTADEPLTALGTAALSQSAHSQTQTASPAPAISPAPESTTTPHKRQFVSPRARRVAQEFGVDVSQLIASSKSGRIMEADVRKFLTQRAPAPAPTAVVETPRPVFAAASVPSGDDIVIPVGGVRKVIFDRMASSARDIARVTLTTEADATELVALREQLNAKQSELRFSFTDLLILLTARALLKYPYMNATLRDDGVHQHAFVNLGVAADTERGLLVPIVRDAHRKGLAEIYADVRRLSEAARTGKISPDDLRGGTFTITNLGAQEIDAFTPIVNQPEIAILGVGRIAQKPAAHQGQLALRWMVALSLSFDHRIVDGAPAGKFLQHVKHCVETPALVLI
jgi:pyruvate dehydrogenase E2 component (dihydrolipoamide acetyltransferase)